MTDNTQRDNHPAASTAGGLLKAARLAAGVPLSVLSVSLKVPVRQLESLEADLYMVDPNPVFARALAASVCRQLGVDASPILALMPMSSKSLEANGALRQAISVPINLGRVRRARRGSFGRTGWMAAGMLVLIVALIWWPSPAPWSQTTPLASAVVTPSELVFSAQNPSWIEVWDGRNGLVWQGVLSAGDLKLLSVSLPVSVVVGRSDAVKMSLQGQPVDLKPYTQVNTARLEVKP
ncbi:helix-turn-helix domain-containing protein [Limnohabitans sp. DCL3]|jgi:hypothetical protein|uniref:helix-turn-helix domain-containing protein n=1 Tax=Limnohabitans sp. DCL3 TaxID=3374103 RepID=UPI003A86D4CE